MGKRELERLEKSLDELGGVFEKIDVEEITRLIREDRESG